MEKKIFNLPQGHFLSLCKQKIPLDCIYLIEALKNGEDVEFDEFMPFLQRCQRKGYIDGKGQLTKYGEELYDSLFEEAVAVKKKPQVEKNVDFEAWWGVYPTTNDFEIEGKHFQGTQNKRIRKEDCNRLFDIICNSFTAEDVIKATEYHIETAKQLSFKRRENQLTYIPNSERYLREKYFAPYIEKYKRKQPIVAKKDFEI